MNEAVEQEQVSRFMTELERVGSLFSPDSVRHLHTPRSLSWTQPLSLAERTDMQRDYARGLFEGTRTGDWTLLADAEASWRATAEVAGDPALSASLLAERDPAREIALRRL